ncbi:hypothetical protein [Xenorhabdus doucetiae]|nr:hypothetical protein [Xenorhabdus doucetiae]
MDQQKQKNQLVRLAFSFFTLELGGVLYAIDKVGCLGFSATVTY